MCFFFVIGLQQGLGNSSANAQAQAQAQAHMMQQFNPLLYSYQLSMAHQALGKFSFFLLLLSLKFIISPIASAGKSLNVNEIQRLAEMQRQYLMDIIPQQQQQQQSNSGSNRQNNWKT